MRKTYPSFIPFPKIPRLFKECVITEKIDGTNGLIHITGTGDFFVGSRNRWLTEESDNHGFRQWAMDNKDELMKLGVGSHHGEWWGNGIQRGYGLPKGEKRFSLFNVSVWNELNAPDCCDVVPTLYVGEFGTAQIESTMDMLKKYGSHAAPFMNPEGVMVYHTTANQYFKVPFDKNHKEQ